jgi:pimeloyl-ACP methyl ester carboxylesterase
VTSGRPLPLVLVPGACLGGWCWLDVARELRAEGHEVYPVTLTGLGERVHLASRAVNLETHIEDVVNLLEYEDLRDVVLVGHSYAGIVITGVADRRAPALAALVYLDTSPVPDGTAIADVQRSDQREQQLRSVSERGEGWRWPVPDEEILASGMFGSTAGLSRSQLQRLARRGTAQPYATFTSPLHLRHELPPQLRRVAILCSAGGMRIATLRSLAARSDPRAGMFAGSEWELHELDTGHWSMLSAPSALARLLHRLSTQ